jgi:DNA replication protein DnaC
MNQETLDKMHRIRLFGMYQAFNSGMETPRSEPYTADEMTSMLIESEWDDGHNRVLDSGLRNTKFRYKAIIEQVENAEQRGIDKNQLHHLADGSFIKKFENIIITGSTGTGKSFIASAIGHQACQLGFKV